MRKRNSRQTIADLCHFINGNGFKPSDWRTSGLPIIRIQNLNGATSYNYYDGPTKPAWLVADGDLLYAWAGVKGVSFGPTIWQGPQGVLNQHIYKVVPHSNVDRYWLFLALKHVTGKIEAQAHGFKSSLVHVHKEDITGQVIEVPRIEEQQNIGAILQAWDEAVNKLDLLIARYEQSQQHLIYKLVFGQAPFDGELPKRPATKYRWFHLPSHWQCNRIGNLAHEISERNCTEDSAEILSCSKYEGFVRSLDYFKKQVYSSDLAGYKRIYRGDFGFPSNHVEEGSIGLQNLVDVGLVSPIYTVFRFDKNAIDNEYAFHVLKTSLYRHIFSINTSASVDRRGSLRWNEFALIPFPVPPIVEQRKIAAALSASGRRLSLLRSERQLIERQKRGLMQKLLTGEWRVKC